MKGIFPYTLSVLVLLASCNPNQEESVLREAEIDMLDVISIKKDEATAWLNQLRRVSDQELNKLERIKVICSVFYDSSTSFMDKHYRRENYKESFHYPFDQLNSLYHITLDSLHGAFPQVFKEAPLQSGQYEDLNQRKNTILICAMMQRDVLENYLSILNYLDSQVKLNFGAHPDDGEIYTSPVEVQGHQYSFSIHNQFLQQILYRDIQINSVMRDDNPITTSPIIDNRDVMGVIQLHNLKRGKYTAKVKVRFHEVEHSFTID